MNVKPKRKRFVWLKLAIIESNPDKATITNNIERTIIKLTIIAYLLSKINEYIVWALLFSDEVKNKTSFNNYKCVLNSEINDRLK